MYNLISTVCGFSIQFVFKKSTENSSLTIDDSLNMYFSHKFKQNVLLFITILLCTKLTNANNDVTMIADEFCDFETDDCIWRSSEGIVWRWKRRKINEIEQPGPETDHRGSNSSK